MECCAVVSASTTCGNPWRDFLSSSFCSEPFLTDARGTSQGSWNPHPPNPLSTSLSLRPSPCEKCFAAHASPTRIGEHDQRAHASGGVSQGDKQATVDRGKGGRSSPESRTLWTRSPSASASRPGRLLSASWWGSHFVWIPTGGRGGGGRFSVSSSGGTFLIGTGMIRTRQHRHWHRHRHRHRHRHGTGIRDWGLTEEKQTRDSSSGRERRGDAFFVCLGKLV